MEEAKQYIEDYLGDRWGWPESYTCVPALDNLYKEGLPPC